MVDPYFNEVSLLLHMEGSNGSTTFTDSANSPKTVTVNGNAQISTAQSKWGNGSGVFDGAGDYLSLADHADFSFGSSPFTIEFWLYQTEATGSGQYWGIVGQGVGTASNHSFLVYYNQNGLQILCSISTGSGLLYPQIVSSANNSLNAWHHCAISVIPASGEVYTAFNGVVTLTSYSAFTVPNCTLALEIGRNTSSHYLKNAYLQDLRITKGVARYIANFTPPTAILPDELGHFLPVPSLVWTPNNFTQSGNAVQSFLPTESIAWTAVDPFATPILPAESLTWTAQPLLQLIAHDLPATAITWNAQAPSGLLSHILSAATLTWSAQRPQQTYDAPSFAVSRAVYRCYLTGDGEDPPVADLELPLASFQSRRRNGEQTYLAITVPNPVPYITEINARLNGDIVIYSGFAVGAVENLTELLRVNFGSFRYDLGARSGSASLSGHKQVTYSNPKTRALSGISYRSVTDGITLVRCEPDMWLNPGDTADLGGGETFVVDTISYTIKPTLATMEVQEVTAEEV